MQQRNALTIIRIVIFGLTMSCITSDALLINFINSYTYYSGYTVGGGLIFSMLNDIGGILVSGYYIFTFESRREFPPITADYIICGSQTVLWLIYAILQFIGISYSGAVPGLFIMVLYLACAVLLYQWHQQLNPGGGMNSMNNQRPVNNPVIGMNNLGANNPGIGVNNPGMGMNNPGMGMNHPTNSGVILNTSGVGLNTSGVGLNTSGIGLNNSGVGMNQGYGMNGGYVVNSNPPVYGMNNPVVGTNNPVMSNAGLEKNNAGSEAYISVKNAGSEHV